MAAITKQIPMVLGALGQKKGQRPKIFFLIINHHITPGKLSFLISIIYRLTHSLESLDS